MLVELHDLAARRRCRRVEFAGRGGGAARFGDRQYPGLSGRVLNRLFRMLERYIPMLPGNSR